jgi:pilus assembly protein CpaD
MARNAAILAACAGAALLAACQQPPDRRPLGPERHKVQVTQRIDSIKVPFRENSAALPPSAKAGLQGFLTEIGAGRDAVVVVRAPTRARGDLGAQRRNAVLRFLKAEGFRPTERDALMPEVDAPASEVLVRVAQYGTKLPACPDHSRSELGGNLNRHTSNYGCATNRNLGLMVANPRDLVRGRELAPARTSRQRHRIRDYRAGKPIGGDGGGDGPDVATGGSS